MTDLTEKLPHELGVQSCILSIMSTTL